MECKYRKAVNNNNWYYELIDTLWNVNCLLEYFEYLEGRELIDTLWNVN